MRSGSTSELPVIVTMTLRIGRPSDVTTRPETLSVAVGPKIFMLPLVAETVGDPALNRNAGWSMEF
jgi:hypothetical protein